MIDILWNKFKSHLETHPQKVWANRKNWTIFFRQRYYTGKSIEKKPRSKRKNWQQTQSAHATLKRAWHLKPGHSYNRRPLSISPLPSCLSFLFPLGTIICRLRGRGEDFWGSHGFQGEQVGDQSPAIECKGGGAIENWQPMSGGIVKILQSLMGRTS